MKKALILISVLFVVVTAIVVLGNVIVIGEKLTALVGVPYLGYAFYALLFALFMYLVLYPMYLIFSTPEFPTLTIEEQAQGVTDEAYRKRLTHFASATTATTCPRLSVRPIRQPCSDSSKR